MTVAAGVTFGHGIVYSLAIIRAARCDRRDLRIDLVVQMRYFKDVANIVRSQFNRDDFIRVGIHAEVRPAPPRAHGFLNA